MLPDSRYTDAFSKIPATGFRQAIGCSPTLENPAILGYVSDGSWATYDALDFGMGAGYFEVRASTPLIGGAIEIWIRGSDGKPDSLLGVCKIPSTGGWNSWVQAHGSIRPVKGVHDIKLVFRRSAGDNVLCLFELESFSFSASAAGLLRDAACRMPSAEADNMTPPVRTVFAEDPDECRVTSGYTNGSSILFSRIKVNPGHNWFEARVWISSPGDSLEIHCMDLTAEHSRLVGVLPLSTDRGRRRWVTAGCSIEPFPDCPIMELRYCGTAGARTFKLNWVGFSSLVEAQRPLQRVSAGPVMASHWSLAHSIQNEPCSEGGNNIGYVRDGSFIRFDWVDFDQDGLTRVLARVAAIAEGGEIDILVDGKKLATIMVPCTREWQRWVTVSARLSETVRGVHKLECRFKGNSGFLFNLRWIQFSDGSSAAEQDPHCGITVIAGGQDPGFNAWTCVHPGKGRSHEQMMLFPLCALVDAARNHGMDLELLQDDPDELVLKSGTGILRVQPARCRAIFEPFFLNLVSSVPTVSPTERPTDIPIDSSVPYGALEWSLPAECVEKDRPILLPGSVIAAATGILHRHDRDEGCVRLRFPDLALPGTHCVENRDGMLMTDQGTPLRGLTLFVDDEKYTSFDQLEGIKRTGFNTLHVYGESPDAFEHPGDGADIMDDLVEYTARTGLHLVLGCSSGRLTGRLNVPWTQAFWQFYAPRYARYRHVVFELLRQPHPWSAPYPDSVIALQRELLDLVNIQAPDHQVLLFSYGNLSKPESVLRDLQALHLDESERQRVAVGWVGWDRQMETIGSCLKVLKRHGWATVNVQVPYGLRVQKPDPIPDLVDVDMVRLCEQTKTAWLSSIPVCKLDTPGLTDRVRHQFVQG